MANASAPAIVTAPAPAPPVSIAPAHAPAINNPAVPVPSPTRRTLTTRHEQKQHRAGLGGNSVDAGTDANPRAIGGVNGEERQIEQEEIEQTAVERTPKKHRLKNVAKMIGRLTKGKKKTANEGEREGLKAVAERVDTPVKEQPLHISVFDFEHPKPRKGSLLAIAQKVGSLTVPKQEKASTKAITSESKDNSVEKVKESPMRQLVRTGDSINEIITPPQKARRRLRSIDARALDAAVGVAAAVDLDGYDGDRGEAVDKFELLTSAATLESVQELRRPRRKRSVVNQEKEDARRASIALEQGFVSSRKVSVMHVGDIGAGDMQMTLPSVQENPTKPPPPSELQQQLILWQAKQAKLPADQDSDEDEDEGLVVAGAILSAAVTDGGRLPYVGTTAAAAAAASVVANTAARESLQLSAGAMIAVADAAAVQADTVAAVGAAARVAWSAATAAMLAASSKSMRKKSIQQLVRQQHHHRSPPPAATPSLPAPLLPANGGENAHDMWLQEQMQQLQLELEPEPAAPTAPAAPVAPVTEPDDAGLPLSIAAVMPAAAPTTATVVVGDGNSTAVDEDWWKNKSARRKSISGFNKARALEKAQANGDTARLAAPAPVPPTSFAAPAPALVPPPAAAPTPPPLAPTSSAPAAPAAVLSVVPATLAAAPSAPAAALAPPIVDDATADGRPQIEQPGLSNGMQNGVQDGHDPTTSAYVEQHSHDHPFDDGGGYDEYGYDGPGAEGRLNGHAQTTHDNTYEQKAYTAAHGEKYTGEYADTSWYGGDDDWYGQQQPAEQSERLPQQLQLQPPEQPLKPTAVQEHAHTAAVKFEGVDESDPVAPRSDPKNAGGHASTDGATGAEERKKGLLNLARSRYKERKQKNEKKRKGARICVQVQGIKDIRWPREAAGGAGSGEPLITIAVGKQTEFFVQPQSLRQELDIPDGPAIGAVHMFHTDVVFEGVDIKRAFIISLARVVRCS
jgi:hypothetical protein